MSATTADQTGHVHATQHDAIAALRADGASVEIVEHAVITGSVHLLIEITDHHGRCRAICAPSGRVHHLG